MKDTYQPIENYGIIGDLNTIALAGIDGSIDFMCLPDFDSPTIFGALLDRRNGGFFQISSCEENVKKKQLYIPETNILLTRFLYEDGIGEITDFMPLESFFKKNMLIRRVKSIKGKITYRMQCCPRFDYGQKSHKTKFNNNAIFFHSKGGFSLKLLSSIPMEVRDGDGYAEFTLKAGETVDFILQKDDNDTISSLNDFVNAAFIHTLNFWKEWAGRLSYNGRWREMVSRSALTLKLLISEKHGAVIAAPTFGLPEKIGGNKNWDYRFVWIRDAAFTVHALLLIGYKKEAESFMRWIQSIFETLNRKTNIKPFYKIDGSNAEPAQLLTHFEGYRESAPVAIGNDAVNQLQLDNYGEFIDAIYLCDKYVSPISHDMWNYLVSQIGWLTKNWKRKDYSIWEERGKPQEFLYSRLMCWVAFDRMIKIGQSHSYPFPNSWIKERNTIFESIYKNFWSKEKGAFIQFKGSQNIDASSLLMPLIRFISPMDPMWLSSLEYIEKNLGNDCMVYRYSPSTSQLFGLKKGEGTFSACSFWYIECLSRSGQLQKAEIYFDKMLSYANHVGLYSEQLGFQGEHLGNFPQAFTHLSLISAAYDLNKRLNRETNS